MNINGVPITIPENIVNICVYIYIYFYDPMLTQTRHRANSEAVSKHAPLAREGAEIHLPGGREEEKSSPLARERAEIHLPGAGNGI